MNSTLLVILPNYIGDVIMTTPAIRKISENFPSGRIVAVVSEGAYPAVKNNPRISDFILRPQRFRGISSRISFIKNVKSRCPGGCDVAYVFRNTFFNRILSAVVSRRRFFINELSGGGIPYKIAALKTVSFQSPEYDKKSGDGSYERDELVSDALRTEFYLSPQDVAVADGFIESNALSSDGGEGFAVIHPCTSRPAKNWRPDNFSRLASYLFSQYGLKTVFTGSAADVADIEKIIRMLDKKEDGGICAIRAAGILSLGETAALISRSAIVVSSDTGIMHVAYTLGKKTIGLFGSTEPAKYGPYPPEFRYIYKMSGCPPCYKDRCYRRKDSAVPPCMEAITPEDVYKASDDLIARK